MSERLDDKIQTLRRLIEQAGPLTKGSMDPLFEDLLDARAVIEGKPALQRGTREEVIDSLIERLARTILKRTTS